MCIDVKSTGLYQSDPILAKHGNKVILVKTGHSYVKEAVREHDALA